MGTRHIIAVQVDGEYKIAQYGQWDGYREGQGLTVLRFLQGVDHKAFADKCRKLTVLSDDAASEIDRIPDWPEVYPHLSRDAGAKILHMVDKASEPLALSLHPEFALDSLMCEFAYVIDFDANTFEVFEGFNKKPVATGRFVGGMRDGGNYGPVNLVQQWPLDALPTEDEFLSGGDKGSEGGAE